MILLTDSGGGNRPSCSIPVFGVGLLGSAIVNAVTSTAHPRVERIPLSWTDPALQERQLQELEARIAAPLQESPAACLKVLWSAGRAGFAATEAEIAVELESFQAVLGMTERLARRFPDAGMGFYLLSSAGGLFEGQRHVDQDSKPEPRRPYGVLKQRQEQLLAASGAPITKRIYRPTSVYGYLRPNQRIGLISTLILNGLRHQVSNITAWMSTLRDFVFVEDIARYISRVLLEDDARGEESTAVLAHAKPFSIFEIEKMVENVLGRKIYVSYSLEPSNQEDITFSHSVLPPGWHSSDLSSNISLIYKEAVASGAAFGQPPRLLDRS
ncbi:MAG TPA: NAD-dependent epimerase/dehydratase family protein [Thermoanaerobaculia bacterium]